MPFTLRDRTLDFFSGTPGSVRVVAGDREYVYSLTLPQLWDSQVGAAGRGAARASRGSRRSLDGSSDLWPWLALLGGARTVAEWLLYGRFRRGRFAVRTDADAAQIAEPPRRRGDDFRSSLALLLALAAGGLGGVGMAIVGAAPGAAAEGAARSPRSRWRWRSRGSRCTRAKSRWRCWPTLPPASRRRTCRRESAFADQAGARARTALDAHHSVRARHARRRARTSASRTAGICTTPPGPRGHGTNLEAAIRDGAAALPAGMVPRLLLVSDGNENLGSVARAIWQAQQLGIPVDTVPLAGRPKPGLRAGIGRDSRTGVQRRAFPDRCHAGIAARRARPRWR